MDRRRAPRPGRRRWPPVLSAGSVLVLVAALVAVGVTAAAHASPRAHTKVGSVHHSMARSGQAQRSGVRPATSSAPRAASSGQACGFLAAQPTRVTHVIWIVMENRSYTQVIGAPYIASLGSQCGVATNYHNVSHPSLPNYIAMTSGRPMGQLPTTDCPKFCPVSGPSIFTQTSSWRVYAESMPGACVRHDARPYVAHHTAAPYYSSVTNCASNDVPLTAFNPAALPSFSLIIPNVYNDMHENSSSVTAGDNWLRAHLGAILASPTYRDRKSVV